MTAQVPHFIRKSFVGVVFYPIGAAGAWVTVHAAFLVYLLAPLCFIVPPRKESGSTPTKQSG